MTWSLRDIELELGRDITNVDRLLAVLDLRARADDIERRMRVLAMKVAHHDAIAQDAVIERGDDPRSWSLEEEA